MKEIISWGSIRNFEQYVAGLGSKPLIVRGNKSYEPAKEYVDSLDAIHFSDFQPNPHVEDIEKAITLYRTSGCDYVIGLGGGTAMDIAKAVALLAPLDDPVVDYVTKKKTTSERKIPLALIPTTAGTGSEATHFSVVYVNKTKYSLKHSSLIPDISIIDPSLTLTLSPYQTACTGIDALSQAVEAFWSIHSTDESKEYSRQAIPLIIDNLAKAVNENDKDARVAMAKASNLAGKAINIAKTTAAHAVSYPMTSYFKVPHGLACGLTLPHWLFFNAQVDESSNLNEKRGVEYVKDTMQEMIQLLDSSTAQEARQKILQVMKECNLPISLGEVAITSLEDIQLILDNGFNPERVVNNPRLVTKKVLKELLDSIV